MLSDCWVRFHRVADLPHGRMLLLGRPVSASDEPDVVLIVLGTCEHGHLVVGCPWYEAPDHFDILAYTHYIVVTEPPRPIVDITGSN